LTGIKVGILPLSKDADHTYIGKMLEKMVDLNSLLSG